VFRNHQFTLGKPLNYSKLSTVIDNLLPETLYKIEVCLKDYLKYR